MHLDEVGDFARDLGIDDHLATGLRKHRQWDAPGALS